MVRRGFLATVAAVLTGRILDDETPRWPELPDRWSGSDPKPFLDYTRKAVSSAASAELDAEMKRIYGEMLRKNQASETDFMDLFTDGRSVDNRPGALFSVRAH